MDHHGTDSIGPDPNLDLPQYGAMTTIILAFHGRIPTTANARMTTQISSVSIDFVSNVDGAVSCWSTGNGWCPEHLWGRVCLVRRRMLRYQKLSR